MTIEIEPIQYIDPPATPRIDPNQVNYHSSLAGLNADAREDIIAQFEFFTDTADRLWDRIEWVNSLSEKAVMAGEEGDSDAIDEFAGDIRLESEGFQEILTEASMQLHEMERAVDWIDLNPDDEEDYDSTIRDFVKTANEIYDAHRTNERILSDYSDYLYEMENH